MEIVLARPSSNTQQVGFDGMMESNDSLVCQHDAPSPRLPKDDSLVSFDSKERFGVDLLN
jgi:hypothetical protein